MSKSKELEEILEKVVVVEPIDSKNDFYLKLLEKIDKLERKEEEKSLNVLSLPSDQRVIPKKPKKVVFQIKGYVADDNMKDGAYIPGKTFGLSKHKLISHLLNVNREWENKTLDKWRTGLEVDEIELNPNLTQEQKDVLISEIKIARAWLEYKTGQSFSDVNNNIWSKQMLTVDDITKVYNTTKDEDLILYHNILGGGHVDIASNYTACKKANKQLYLAVYEDEAKRKMSDDKPKWKAFGKMSEIEDNWSIDDCLYLLYTLPTKRSHGFTLNTPKSSLLDMFTSFINGDGMDDKKKKPQEFLDVVSLFSSDPQYIKTKGLFEAALYYGFVISTKEKTFVNKQTGFIYGSSKQQALEKLIDIKNIEELGYIKGKIVEKWNK